MLINSNRATSMRVVVASPPWMYRRMVDGSMVAGRWLTLDAEHLAAWRWVVSEFEEETRSRLIQTGASFSSNLKHGPMAALPSLDPVFSNRAPPE